MKSRYPHILQTPAWGRAKRAAQPAWTARFFVKFSKSSGWEEYSISEIDDNSDLKKRIYDWENVHSSVLILERELGLGQKMHYVPRGPYVDWSNEEDVMDVFDLMKNEAKKASVVFTRMEPNEYQQNYKYIWTDNAGYRKTKDFVQAFDTVTVEIDKPDEELMASFHKKHAYNIRLAGRRGLVVHSSTNPEDVSVFYKLTQKTDVRKSGAMSPHPESYYQSLVQELAKDDMVKVYIVEKDGKPASASVVFTYGEEAIYMFGASDYEFRRDMPNHLREWTSMRDARDAGRKFFDLWGVTMRNDPGEGIKRYKLGYRDHVEKMAGTFDWSPAWWKYYLFNIANKLRRIVR